MRGITDFDARPPCLDADPDLWFAEHPAQLNRAKALCSGCPIKATCLADALSRHEPWGVWGGEIISEGAVLSYKRGRGRPSKTDRERGLFTRSASGERLLTRAERRLAALGTAGACHSKSA